MAAAPGAGPPASGNRIVAHADALDFLGLGICKWADLSAEAASEAAKIEVAGNQLDPGACARLKMHLTKYVDGMLARRLLQLQLSCKAYGGKNTAGPQEPYGCTPSTAEASETVSTIDDAVAALLSAKREEEAQQEELQHFSAAAIGERRHWFVFTSLPDICEMAGEQHPVVNPEITRHVYSLFFKTAVKAILLKLPADSLAIFYQTDMKPDFQTHLSKATLVVQAAEELDQELLLREYQSGGRLQLAWHKVVVPESVFAADKASSTCTSGLKPGFTHLLCVRKGDPPMSRKNRLCGSWDATLKGRAPGDGQNALSREVEGGEVKDCARQIIRRKDLSDYDPADRSFALWCSTSRKKRAGVASYSNPNAGLAYGAPARHGVRVRLTQASEHRSSDELGEQIEVIVIANDLACGVRGSATSSSRPWHSARVFRRAPEAVVDASGSTSSGEALLFHTQRAWSQNVLPAFVPKGSKSATPQHKNRARCQGLECTHRVLQWIRDNFEFGGLVDPFCGAGTGLAVAETYGLWSVGCDLSRRRVRQAERLQLPPGGGGSENVGKGVVQPEPLHDQPADKEGTTSSHEGATANGGG